jgi:hypothetical protein
MMPISSLTSTYLNAILAGGLSTLSVFYTERPAWAATIRPTYALHFTHRVEERRGAISKICHFSIPNF